MKPFFNKFRTNLLLPLVLVLLNLMLRFLDLTARDISLDEPFSIYHAQFQTDYLIDLLKNYNNPPLFELILHYWIKVFGIEPLSVRALPFIFSVCASLAIYFLGKNHLSLLTGLVSALLLSFSNLSQAYAHDCRVYSLFLLLSILSMDFFLRLMKDPSKKNLLIYVLLSTLNIYSHYFAIILIAIQGVCVIIFYRKNFKDFLIAASAILIFYLPHLLVLYTRFSHSAQHGTWVQTPQGIESLYNMLWSFNNQPVTTVFSLLIFTSLFFFATKDRQFYVILLWFLIPVLGIFILSFKIPMYLDRYLIFCMPAWYLLLAFAIEKIKTTNNVKAILAILVISTYILSFDTNPWTQRDIKKAVAYLKNEKSQNDLVIVNPGDFIETFAYHYNRDFFKAVDSRGEYKLVDSLLKNDNVLFLNSAIDIPSSNENYNKVIYFDYSDQKQSAEIIRKISASKTAIIDTIFENGYRISIYKKLTP